MNYRTPSLVIGLTISLCAQICVLSADEQQTSIPPENFRIAIYDHSDGSANGPKNLMQFLTADAGFECKRVTPEEIQEGVLRDFDTLIMPGGSGSLQASKLGQQGRKHVQDFVRDGGGYVGICAGSYLATTHYSWSLGLLNAKVWDRTHWARGNGEVMLSISDAGCQLLDTEQSELKVLYAQGPLLVPDNKAELPGYEVLATYKTEVATKGAQAGSMTDTHAIVRTMFGKGRVICFSPHPESSSGPRTIMTAGVRWASQGLRP